MNPMNASVAMMQTQNQYTDPGTIGTIYNDRFFQVVALVSTTAEARTLDRPRKVGAKMHIYGKTIAGTITLTVTGGYNELGSTTFSFTASGQFLDLVGEHDGTNYYWRAVASSQLGDLASLTATAAELNARAAAASRIVNVTDAATYAILAADSGKMHIMPNFTASCTLSLPAVAAGLEYEFIGSAVAADAESWIFKSASATNFFLGGVAFADTDAGDAADEIHAGIWSNGSSNDFLTVVAPGAGTRIYIICDGTNWIVNGQVFSATVPAFSDT